MKLRNLIVKGKDVYLDMLIRELIKYNISYVLVDNYEIHFEGNIIRLYELDDVLLMNELRETETLIVDFSGLISTTEVHVPSLINNLGQDMPELYIPEIEKEYIFKEEKPKYTKKLIKEQNRMYSRKINTKRK